MRIARQHNAATRKNNPATDKMHIKERGYSMVITLNNRREDIPGRERLNVQELLDLKRFTFKFLVVRINGKPVKPDDYGSSMIQDGDEVMVLHLISGG